MGFSSRTSVVGIRVETWIGTSSAETPAGTLMMGIRTGTSSVKTLALMGTRTGTSGSLTLMGISTKTLKGTLAVT